MISRSEKRNTFQLEKYLERCAEKGEEPDKEYIAMYENIFLSHNTRFDDPEKKSNNMEYDLLTTDWILEKVRTSETYSQNLYAALCNNEFVKNDIWPRLQDKRWSCSWRYAGGIIADMRQEGDYIDWYCSGIGSEYPDRYVGEGRITEEIRGDLFKLGWIIVESDENAV